jgi:hypothetical protein
VQQVRERMSGGQQTGSMQDPADGLPRITLPRTLVNKGKMKGRVSSFGPGPLDSEQWGSLFRLLLYLTNLKFARW